MSEYKRGDREHSFIVAYNPSKNQIFDKNNSPIKLEKDYKIKISFYDNDPVFYRIKDMIFDDAHQLFNAACLVQ